MSDGRLAVSEEHLWGEFWEMVAVLGVGLPITMAFVAITGYLLAARALNPVDTMAKRAAEITADQLHERLKVDNPEDELGSWGQRSTPRWRGWRTPLTNSDGSLPTPPMN